jgi:hypothetical protein
MRLIKIKDSNNYTYDVRKYKGFFIQNYYGPVFNPERENKNCYIISKLNDKGVCLDCIGEALYTIKECKQAIKDIYDPTGAMTW